ncbi:MAG: hypothetical protein K1Y36_25680 [Blastocatellia bacterium]|nr:hypothetical protein [Blastocatellia bacterium]
MQTLPRRFIAVSACLLGCLLLFGTLSATGQIQFSRPKNPDPLLDNPYTFALTREELTEMVKQTLKDMEIPLDEAKSKEKPGIIVTKPVIFTKGGPSGENLEYVSRRPAGDARNWLRGRYSLQVEVAPIDPQRTKLFVFARVEGEFQDDLAPKWVECPSRGVKEDDFLKLIIKRVNGEQ